MAMALHTVLMPRRCEEERVERRRGGVRHALGRCPRVVARFRRAQQILKRSSAHVVGQLHEWEHIAAGFVLLIGFMITCLVRLRASLLVIHHCAAQSAGTSRGRARRKFELRLVRHQQALDDGQIAAPRRQRRQRSRASIASLPRRSDAPRSAPRLCRGSAKTHRPAPVGARRGTNKCGCGRPPAPIAVALGRGCRDRGPLRDGFWAADADARRRRRIVII